MRKKIALFFPGQGSQKAGMSRSFFENSISTKKLFDEATRVIKNFFKTDDDFDLARLCLDGPENELRKTQNAQPIMFVLSMAILKMFYLRRPGFRISCVAGHSLGEYGALCATGVFDFEEGVKLVRKRGEAMAMACESSPGVMTAVIGLDWRTVKKCCDKIATGTVVAANYNAFNQVVISGETNAVLEAKEVLKIKGARVIDLRVAGAFHSPLMRPAQNALKEALEKIEFRAPLIPFVSSVSGNCEQYPLEIKDLLYSQLTSPVKWVDCVLRAEKISGIAVELGSNILSNLAKTIAPNLECYPLQKTENIEDFLEKA